MDKNEQLKVMVDVRKNIENMLQTRLNNRIEASVAYEPTSLDNLPDKVKEMRELQAAQNRAVMQELRDILSVMKVMYPDV